MALVENVLKNHEISSEYVYVIIQSKNEKIIYWGSIEDYNLKFRKFEVLEERKTLDKKTVLLRIDFE